MSMVSAGVLFIIESVYSVCKISQFPINNHHNKLRSQYIACLSYWLSVSLVNLDDKSSYSLFLVLKSF